MNQHAALEYLSAVRGEEEEGELSSEDHDRFNEARKAYFSTDPTAGSVGDE